MSDLRTSSMQDAAPRSLRDPAAIAARRAMLSEAHIASLAGYVTGLRARYIGWEFPDFDPLDGGVNAAILFLLEKPGPMTSPQHPRGGSGFISRDNNDPTAEAIFSFMRQAGIDRSLSVLWNVIPGWNGRRAIGAGEVRVGVEELRSLLALLPNVRKVVLVGNRAQRAAPAIESLGMRVFRSAHPGPLVKGPNRALWERIPLQWAEAASAA